MDEANATLGEKIVLAASRSSPTVTSPPTCTAPSPTCRRRSASWSSWTQARTPRSPRTSRSTSPRSRRLPDPRGGPGRVVETERRLAEDTSREEGKPEAALPKIVEGRVNGFFKENVVLEQAFAKDTKKTVKKVLDEAGVTLKRFARFRVGV